MSGSEAGAPAGRILLTGLDSCLAISSCLGAFSRLAALSCLTAPSRLAGASCLTVHLVRTGCVPDVRSGIHWADNSLVHFRTGTSLYNWLTLVIFCFLTGVSSSSSSKESKLSSSSPKSCLRPSRFLEPPEGGFFHFLFTTRYTMTINSTNTTAISTIRMIRWILKSFSSSLYWLITSVCSS